MAIERGVWHRVDEARRTYFFEHRDALIITKVVRILFSDSGIHYVETEDGAKVIVAPGWTHIVIQNEGGWSILP